MTSERDSAASLHVDLPLADLRTRIADAIQLRWTQLAFDDFVSPSWDNDCLALADAVIRELGLTEAPASWNIE